MNDAALGPLPETPSSVHYPTGFEAWLRWREAVRRRKARALARWRRSKSAEWGTQRAAGTTAVPLAVAERVVVGEQGFLAISCLVRHPQRSCNLSTELANRAQTEVLDGSSGAVKAVHPSRKGLDIAVRLARLREAASRPALPQGKALDRAAAALKSSSKSGVNTDGASSEGYSADFASESAGDAQAPEAVAAAAAAAVAPPEVS